MAQELQARRPQADFALVINFRKDSPDPARIFRAAEAMIAALEKLDRDLVSSIDTRIEPILTLEDIEAGSLKIWLRYALGTLEEVDDDALKKLDWKPQVGKYLVKAKYLMIDFLNRTAQITDRSDFEKISKELVDLATETDVLHLPSYQPLPPATIAQHLVSLAQSKAALVDGDGVTFEGAGNYVTFNMDLVLAPGSFEELLTRETISSRVEMILAVRKPDYLGHAQWEFRHNKKPIPARIEDDEWLRRFQAREEQVRPGDAIRAIVRMEIQYGFDSEVVSEHYAIEKITRIIPAEMFHQDDLF